MASRSPLLLEGESQITLLHPSELASGIAFPLGSIDKFLASVPATPNTALRIELLPLPTPIRKLGKEHLSLHHCVPRIQ